MGTQELYERLAQEDGLTFNSLKRIWAMEGELVALVPGFERELAWYIDEANTLFNEVHPKGINLGGM